MQGVAGGGSGLFTGGTPPDLDKVGGCFSAGKRKPSDLKDSLLEAEGVSEVSDFETGNTKVDQAWTDFRSPETQAFLQKCIRGVPRLSDCSFDFSKVTLTKKRRGKTQIENLTYTDKAGKKYRVNARINRKGQLKIDIPVTVVICKPGRNRVGLFEMDITDYKTTYKYREDKELSPGHTSTGFYDKRIKGSLLGYGKRIDTDAQKKYEGKFENGEFTDGRTFTANVQEGGCLDAQGNLQGKGQFEDTAGLKYKGEFIDGKPNGHGVLQYADGSTYVGEFEDGFSFTAHEGGCFDAQGNLQGKGQFNNENGFVYVGDFKDNQPHGQGTLTFPDGSSYKGEFQDDEYHGEGVLIDKNDVQQKYEGKFENDKFTDGRIFTANVQEGGCLDAQGNLQGKGRFEDTDGLTYEGEFKDGEPNGHGVLQYADGSTYVGEFEDGNLQGRGVLRYFEGSTYEGEFKDGEYHGDGVLIDKTDGQQKYEGKFENGKFTDGMIFTANVQEGGCLDKQGNLQGKGQFDDEKGFKYVGGFKNNKPHGQGVLRYAEGSIYEGEFKDGKPNGQGVLHYADGTTYEGEFKDGKIQGKGEIVYADGTRVKGEF